MLVSYNGQLKPEEDVRISLYDRGMLYGDAVFESLAAVRDRIFFVREHAERMMQGIHDMRIRSPYDAGQLVQLIGEVYDANRAQLPETVRIKAVMSRGESKGPLTIEDVGEFKPNLIIYCDKLTLPQGRIVEEGLKLMSIHDTRPLPHVKTTSYAASVIAYIYAKEQGYDDAVFVDASGNVREGTSFNVISVVKNQLITPSQNVLHGITAQKLLELAETQGFTIIREDIPLEDLVQRNEALVCGTAKRVLPVVQVDNRQVGKGKVGEVTKFLMQEFSTRYY